MKQINVGKSLLIVLSISASLKTQPLHAVTPQQAFAQKMSGLVTGSAKILGLTAAATLYFFRRTQARGIDQAPHNLGRELMPIPQSSALIPAVPTIPVAPTQQLIPVPPSDLLATTQPSTPTTDVVVVKRRFKDIGPRTLTICTAGPLFMWALVSLPPIYFSVILGIILLYILASEWPRLATSKWTRALTPLYPVLPFCIGIYLIQNPAYRNLLVYLFAMVFAHDIGAYLAGSALGKTKIAPRISPNKSWEGCAGGLVFATMALKLMLHISQKSMGPEQMASLVLPVSLIGTAGDFFKSWLKRHAGIKDSGNAILQKTGHGGFLDRGDSAMAAVFWFFLFRNQLASTLLNNGSILKQIEPA
jgi:phosphatidate cytidylyltransferase